MRGTFSVKNFKKYQHYRDRNPPWIKLYNELLDDYAFCRLPDAVKWHLIAIFLLASRYDNKIPSDPKWLAAKIGATIPVDLPQLEAAGFIEFDQGCSKMLADCKQLALPETEREGEPKTEKKDSSAVPKKVGTAQAVIPAEPFVVMIPTNRFETIQEEVGFSQAKLDQWAEAYPGVDVAATMRAIRQWSIDNKSGRKTVTGMNRFVNSWLAREQNRGGNKNGSQRTHPQLGAERNSRFLQGISLGLAALEGPESGEGSGDSVIDSGDGGTLLQR